MACLAFSDLSTLKDKNGVCGWLLEASVRKNSEMFCSLTTHQQSAALFGIKILWPIDVETAVSHLVCHCARIVFHAGNHEGHDFNMFKSQAGGACDCGDEDVMKKEGCVNSCFFNFYFHFTMSFIIHPEGLKVNKLRFQSIFGRFLISDFDEEPKRQRKLYIKIIRSAQIKFRNCIVLSVNSICDHSFEFFKIRRYLSQFWVNNNDMIAW